MAEWGSGTGEAPAALVYASEGAGVQTVVFAAGDLKIAAVVEPGHDPNIMWQRLRTFLEGEGILAAPDPSS